MHEEQIDLLQPVEGVVETVRCRGHARNGVQREQRLAGKVVGRQHVIVHHCEEQHGSLVTTLLQSHRTNHDDKSGENEGRR